MRERFFQPELNADILLNHVITANWKEVETIASTHPDMMFQTAKAVDINGYIIESSPLEYALQMHDMFSLTIFQKYVTAEHRDKFYEIIYQHPYRNFIESDTINKSKKGFDILVDKWRQKDPTVTFEVLREFLRKETRPLMTVKPHLNLQPFFWAYESFFKVFNDQKVSVKESYQFWIKVVGWAQWHILPRHMLKQICAGSNHSYFFGEVPAFKKFIGLLTWSPDADFSYLDYRIPLTVSDHTHLSDRGPWETMETLEDVFNPSPGQLVIGEDFALARGEESADFPHQTHAWNEIYCCGVSGAKEDVAIFRHLADVRHRQVTEMQPGVISRLWNYFSTMA